MFIAYNENKELIYIENADKTVSYTCPLCDEALILKNGTVIRSHFAHKKKSSCDGWNHDMSEWHRNWQEQFNKAESEIVMSDNSEKHIADIFIKESNTVIEFQHSPLSNLEFIKRNKFYSSSHNLFWLFDASTLIGPAYDYINNEYYFRLNSRFKCLTEKYNNNTIKIFLEYPEGKDSFKIAEIKRIEITELLGYTNIFAYLNESIFTREQFIKFVKEYSKTYKIDTPICKYCKIPMRFRYSSKIDSYLWGCPNYTTIKHCTYIENLNVKDLSLCPICSNPMITIDLTRVCPKCSYKANLEL